MKTVFNVILGLCALVLIYICYASIMGPINFEKAKKHRDAAVIARLIDIRKAQLEYRTLHDQQYTASFDSLIDFVKNQKLPFIFKQGELNDKQLEDGLTEKKAINIINKAKKTGNYADVKKWGLENFKRDTLWVAVLDTIFPKGFNPDSMRYVPFGNGAQFEMAIKNDTAKSGAPFCLLEVKTPYTVYLNGLDNTMGYLYDTGVKIDFAGNVENDNIVFLGINLTYHYFLTRDESVGKFLGSLMDDSLAELPDRTLVPLDIAQAGDQIIIISPQDQVNTTIAYQDIFDSSEKIHSVHNLLEVNSGETKITLKYPYFWPGMIVSIFGVIGWILFGVWMRKRQILNKS